MRIRISALCLALAFAGPALADTKAPAVTVRVDQQEYQVSSSAATVGDLLKDLGITLGRLDRTEPSAGARLKDREVIQVTRVSCRSTVEEVPLKARTVVLAVSGRGTGFTRTLCEGRDGRARCTVLVWEKNGRVSSREVIAQKVLQPAQDRVVLRSTPGLANRGGIYHRPLRMRATGYDRSPRCCGPSATGRTATGQKACKGVVAVDTRLIPFGTRLYIPGYGFAVAADRGSAIKGNRIDLCFDSYAEAKNFGVQWVDVFLLPRE